MHIPRGIASSIASHEFRSPAYSAARSQAALPALRAGMRDGGYDELIDADGEVRPHWRPFSRRLGRASARRAAATRRAPQPARARDGHRARYFRRPGRAGEAVGGRSRPARLLRQRVAARSKRPLIQRARLFNAILADVYGEQQLLRDGLIPPALIFSDPAFLSPCHEHQAAGRPSAVLCRRSCARRRRQLARHRQSHGDAGRHRLCARQPRRAHAHRGRPVRSLQWPCAWRRSSSACRRALTLLTGRRDPRIALLTPGPHHDDYFSHAYLARYLGYLLVEGGDLRTAGDRIFLKTLEGLKRHRPHRALRRRAASRDPLELDTDALRRPAGAGAGLPQGARARAQRARLGRRRRTAALAPICRRSAARCSARTC